MLPIFAPTSQTCSTIYPFHFSWLSRKSPWISFLWPSLQKDHHLKTCYFWWTCFSFCLNDTQLTTILWLSQHIRTSKLYSLQVSHVHYTSFPPLLTTTNTTFPHPLITDAIQPTALPLFLPFWAISLLRQHPRPQPHRQPTTTTTLPLRHLILLPQTSIPNALLHHHMHTRSRSGIIKPITRLNLHISSLSPIPKTHIQALRDPYWKSVMLDEYGSLIKNGTWVLFPRPQGFHILLSMWLYK